MALTQAQEDCLVVACFLFNLEAEKGQLYVYGGMPLGAVVDGFCRLTKIERATWETLVWPDRPIKPELEPEARR